MGDTAHSRVLSSLGGVPPPLCRVLCRVGVLSGVSFVFFHFLSPSLLSPFLSVSLLSHTLFSRSLSLACSLSLPYPTLHSLSLLISLQLYPRFLSPSLIFRHRVLSPSLISIIALSLLHSPSLIFFPRLCSSSLIALYRICSLSLLSLSLALPSPTLPRSRSLSSLSPSFHVAYRFVPNLLSLLSLSRSLSYTFCHSFSHTLSSVHASVTRRMPSSVEENA